MRPSHRIITVTAAAATIAGSLAAPAPALAGGGDRVAVANAQPDAVRSARPTGTADTRHRIEVTLYLAQRNPAGLAAAVRAVSDPTSAHYGHYLTPAQFRARYAPSAATVAAVKGFLRGNGLRVTAIPANHAYVAAMGTVGQVQKAFATSLKRYRLGGHEIRAAAVQPTIPRNLANGVIAVSGVASHAQLMVPAHEGGPRVTRPGRAVAGTSAPPPPAFVNAPPCSEFYGEKTATSAPAAFGSKQPYAPCGYVPAQLQGAYGLSGLIADGKDGRDVTVAITDAYAAPTILHDANTYARRHGQEPFASGQFKQVVPNSFRFGFDDQVFGDLCGEQGWYGEETLDVEAVHAMAPGADITYVASRSCDNGDFARTINKVVDRHLADIVTNSWGGRNESNGSPHLDKVYEQIFEQAAVEGIGFYFASGDHGDGSVDNNGTPTVISPANSPFVTAVGGTSLGVSKGRDRLFETGWSTGKSTLVSGSWDPAPPGDFLYGAGGGTSRVFEEPNYQDGVAPDSLAQRYSDEGGRVVPDISMDGDVNTGMLIGETQTFPDGSVRYSEFRLGGTSLSSPLFAGVMAIADQVKGRAHGFANPAIYRLFGTDALYDPRPVGGKGVVRVDFVNTVDDSDGLVISLRSLDVTVDNILRTRAGYDDVTGVGTPNGEKFVSRLGR